MTARDDILKRIKGTQTELPEIKIRTRQFDDLGEQFATALTRAKGETHLVDSRDAAIEKLRELMTELDIENVVTHHEPPLEGISDLFPDQRWHFATETEDYRATCARADLGLTSAEYAFAETGSLVIVSAPDKARMTSLLPLVHIVLLPESRLLPSIFDWVEKRPDPFPANLVFVSGPSKTADIEQTLIVGVHGPKRLVVILYKECSVMRDWWKRDKP